jgi:hypothetical protein
MTETSKAQVDSNKHNSLSKSKSATNFINFPEKLAEAIEMNVIISQTRKNSRSF